MGPAVDQLREAGREADAEVLAHISPARSSDVNHFGPVTVDHESELAQLDDQGNRPLHGGHRRRRSRARGCPWPASGGPQGCCDAQLSVE
ncbi:hypothetical protein [Streptomyces sp. NPDC005989]|uniref:hypothetical protein n=1 Tax=Streptomyces sp. NPDC005989 TaxID=3156727 RepID=UPI0033DCC23F